MAFTVGQRVRVADQSSEYRKRRGTVKSVAGTLYGVQIEGQGCAGTAPLRLDQLKADGTTLVVSYARCSG